MVERLTLDNHTTSRIIVGGLTVDSHTTSGIIVGRLTLDSHTTSGIIEVDIIKYEALHS